MSRAPPSVTSCSVGACIVDTEVLNQLSRKRHVASFETPETTGYPEAWQMKHRAYSRPTLLTDQKLEARQHLRYY